MQTGSGNIIYQTTEVYSEPCHTSMLDRFPKLVNNFNPLTIFAKSSNFGRVLHTPLNINKFTVYANLTESEAE